MCDRQTVNTGHDLFDRLGGVAHIAATRYRLALELAEEVIQGTHDALPRSGHTQRVFWQFLIRPLCVCRVCPPLGGGAHGHTQTERVSECAPAHLGHTWGTRAHGLEIFIVVTSDDDMKRGSRHVLS